MAETTKIQWCDHTFNPWRGCTKVSPGCKNCYAETLSKRNPRVLGVWGDDGSRSIAADSYWRLPYQWNHNAKEAGERGKVFCASLADVFEDRPELVHPRTRLFHLIDETPYLDWLLLTKRPQNVMKCLQDSWRSLYDETPERIEVLTTHQWIQDWQVGNAPANVWLGVSVEDQQRAEERLPSLLQLPARIKFVSFEPLLGPIDLSDPLLTEGLDWAILGGESGRQARPLQLSWLRDMIPSLRLRGVAVFVKQLGSHPQSENDGDAGEGDGYALGSLILKDAKGGDPREWPDDLRIRDFPDTRDA